jgi:hypothetical protein
MEENNIQPQQPANNKKDNKNLLIIVGILVAIIAIVLIVVLVIKPGNGGTGGGILNPVEQKITIEEKQIGNNKVLVSVDSNKTDIYDVAFTLTIYDENKEITRVFEETAHAVTNGQTTYHVVDTSGVLKENYTYEINVTGETKKDSSKIFTDKMTQKNSKKDNMIEIELTNTATNPIDSVQVAVVYYNAKEPVHYTSQFIADMPADASILEYVYIPTNETGELIKFDDYKVVITAYNHEK